MYTVLASMVLDQRCLLSVRVAMFTYTSADAVMCVAPGVVKAIPTWGPSALTETSVPLPTNFSNFTNQQASF